MVLRCIDALFEDEVVGFVFVEQLEFAAADPHQRIEPLQDGQERSQQQIHGMPAADVRPLVGQDGGIAFIIAPRDDDVPQPAERGRFLRDQMKGIAVTALGGRAAQLAEHRAVRAQVEDQCDEGAEKVKCQNERLPGERHTTGCRRHRGLGLIADRHDNRFQPSRIKCGPVHPERNERQQQARRAAGQQRDPVEPEPSAPTHHQQEEGVEHGQQQRAFYNIDEETGHLRCLSIWAIRALSSSRSIFSSSTKRETTLA